MNKILKTFFPLLALAACSQEPAKVEYHLENVYGYGDVQGPPSADSPEGKKIAALGAPVQIEDISKDGGYQAPVSVEENGDAKAAPTQVYTQSEKVGPGADEQQIVKAPVTSDTQSVKMSGKTHTVKKGETLFSIARQYDIPILPIIVTNGLEQPYALTEGQELQIPKGKYHTVAPGETLYSVSRIYGVDMSGIVKMNDLKTPYNLVQGQRLQIPFPSDLPSEQTVAESAAVSNEHQNNQPLAETASEEQAAQPAKTAANNEDGKPASLARPTGGFLGEIKTDSKGNVISVGSEKVAPTKIDTEEENAKLADKNKKTIDDTAPAKVDIKAADSKSTKFAWPLKGKVVKKFGEQNGEYNDGINIAASAGSTVKAANSGRVVYTGNSLKSYGNMVIIKHDDGLLSAYAHMNNINVKKDEKVTKGQDIGTVGSTGKVTSPQLYFAIRKGKDAKDPMSYLN